MRQAMQRFGHPERTFAARRALAAAFVRVKFGDVRQRFDDVRRIIHHDDRARTGHAAGGNQRIEIVRQIEHVDLLLDVFAVRPFALELKFLAGFENFRRRAAGNDRFQFAAVAQARRRNAGSLINCADRRFADFDLVIARASSPGR